MFFQLLAVLQRLTCTTLYISCEFSVYLIDPIIYKNHITKLVRNILNQTLCCPLVTAVAVKCLLLLPLLAAAGAVLPGLTLRPGPAVSGRAKI